MTQLLHELVLRTADTSPAAIALTYASAELDYATLATEIRKTACGFRALGLGRQERVAVYLEKRFETVIAVFGAAAAGGVYVPINPVLKPDQVAYVLRDCNVRILVTSASRWAGLRPTLTDHGDLIAVVLVDERASDTQEAGSTRAISWQELTNVPAESHQCLRVIDSDMASILYTSGSTGKPKGVILSHRNVVAGADSVAQYLENGPDDRILAVLPLSFDAGFSQLTTAFRSGACAVLLNYLLPRDIINMAERQRVTGITAVPPLWIQLAQLEWPASVQERLRYIANTGGRMPRATLDRLRSALPRTRVFLMYGLTEAFRSTYLDPTQLDRRPDSIGKAIPNAEIMVVREDGSPCAPHEPGELVHRGALVSLGYWNDPEKTAERFRPAPGRPTGITLTEMAVWSGDSVFQDEEGFIYFVGRRDEMIKTSGYRVSPTEVEEVVYSTGLVSEVAAFGVPHPVLGQSVALAVCVAESAGFDTEKLISACREKLPAYMIPAQVEVHTSSLPRNPNGKIDRKLLAERVASRIPAISS